MSEEERRVKRPGDSLVLGELLAVVGRQCMNTRRKRRQQRKHGSRDSIGSLGGRMGHQAVTGRALVERDESLSMPDTLTIKRL